jgi:hypothetical protein
VEEKQNVTGPAPAETLHKEAPVQRKSKHVMAWKGGGENPLTVDSSCWTCLSGSL